jgi:replicative DNA helicase
VRADRAINNPTVELGETSRTLREAAGALDLILIVLCQLNRAVEGREDKRPTLADIRQSGSLEEHADIIAALYREDYYVSRREPAPGSPEHEAWLDERARCAGIAELIILKARDDETGKRLLRFDAAATRFSDLTRWS